MSDFIRSSLLEWGVYLILGLIMFFVIDWVTGDGLVFSGRNQDERKQMIKRKSIVSSWLALLILFVANFVRDYFHLGAVSELPLKHPEGFYLIVALVSFFIFYAFNSWKMRA
jgi:hypothetical protein